MSSRKHVLVAVLVGAGFAGALGYFIKENVDRDQEIQSLEGRLAQLQSSLAKKEEELNTLRARSIDQHDRSAPIRVPENHADSAGKKAASREAVADSATRSLQILKELESGSDADRRSYLEKLQELLSSSPSDEEIAIASRFIFEKARDQQGLPDYALQSLYASQSDPDLRRVIAQVLSQRGNNALLNNQIAEAQARLMSSQPRVRQDALAQLAKTHSTKAVDAIAPLLQDPDTTVRLEALFALRDTGNQQHAGLAEALIHDPDPSVSTLASDVSSSLKNLSASARTNYSRSDIEMELPPIANP